MNNSRFESWIFGSYSPGAEALGFYRIFASLMFLFFLLPDFTFYSVIVSLPSDFFTPPPGPMMLFDDFPPALLLQGVHFVLVLSWVCVLLGVKTKLSSITAGLSMLIIQGFLFSLGKVNHELLLSVTPIVMAFTNWGATFSFDSFKGNVPQKTEGWPLVMLALFIGFMMFTAGFPKILGGWLDPSTQATKGHLLNQYFMRGRQELLADEAIKVDSAWVWELLDWATVFFEVGFLVAVLKANWFRLFVCFAVVFHFSTMMTLNIAFLPNFLAYAAFFRWDLLVSGPNRKTTGKKSMQNRYTNVFYFSISLFLSFMIIRWISDSELMTAIEPSLHEVILLTFFLLVVILLAGRKYMSFRNASA